MRLPLASRAAVRLDAAPATIFLKTACCRCARPCAPPAVCLWRCTQHLQTPVRSTAHPEVHSLKWTCSRCTLKSPSCIVCVTGGEYSVQSGFGWTNGVMLSLLERYGWNTSAYKAPASDATAAPAGSA